MNSHARWRCLLVCVVILAQWKLVAGMMLVDLGKRYGLDVSNSNAPMHEGALRQIMDGVRDEKPDSMYLFGLMQFYGHGVTQDKNAAIRFFRKAAADRHVDAQFALGLLYHNGADGTAIRWVFLLVCSMTHAPGVRQDDAMAYSFLKPSADRGHADSQWLLGT
ncbi:hypothetical protein DYB25_002371 [Aphanomyces astaci]|uniref:Sel1 repeat family protein n=1 Tax=Aphanomyces astaci TaxID=112090 RepID=A0A397BN37_APHAT|nr:hypothetical protein DYB25_002371 [Aphanomyces astaci]RHY40220.1 hypothetical protein DYB30_012314 [Aphanomyces astaci]RHY53351.1 hypothetical protein DYB38_006147 [Aphanomyces astaci]RHZ39660.1 hypothetical protein DYB26_008217 [Aphanomyces astaci]